MYNKLYQLQTRRR